MENKKRKVLIAGASIAGPVLAYWLSKFGFEVSIVERAPSLRLGGQSIDVNGPARRVAEWMGILDAIKAANTGEVGTQWVDKNNEVTASFPKEGAASLTQELEIVRGDLVEILYNLTKNDVEYLFDDQIESLEQDEQEARVHFARGHSGSYDLVIAADGIRSKTRKLMFGDEPEFRYLGMCTAYLTIEKAETDTDWARWYTADDSRVLLLRPDRQGTTRASINFLLPEEEYHKLEKADHKPLLLERLDGCGWEAPRLAREVEKSDDLYFDGIGQIKAPKWSAGRFAMVGDAACCPSPVSGKGATLAIVGAYILGGELARHADYRDGLKAYESLMRPYAESVQDLPPGVPRLAYPKTALGVSIVNTVMGVIASDAVQKVAGLFSKSDPEEEMTMDGKPLPEYGMLAPGNVS
ncbi:FAD-dependent oxidoreductase [Dyadobacter beijingensis]|uniref:FAD-dependent oxidoreductase n=1 Tax=Dyadobacter beijingensis TaxID=365489 RepID=A0ABQ2IL06_9BACT|nr:FAD-dependent monooxygenase [Dyadobacter beijingensis]GGN13018.1 FAD-dependent oxidoreductase [Dyadobacter beijingensis]